MSGMRIQLEVSENVVYVLGLFAAFVGTPIFTTVKNRFEEKDRCILNLLKFVLLPNIINCTFQCKCNFFSLLRRFEQTFLTSLMSRQSGDWWIGLSNVGSLYGRYTWSNGRAAKFTNWGKEHTGKPCRREMNEC